MATRTYVPQLLFVLKHAYKYGSRWSPFLATHLSAPQMACLTSTLQAIHDCIVLIEPS